MEKNYNNFVLFIYVFIMLQIISGLISASELSTDPGKFAESRRDALKALAR